MHDYQLVAFVINLAYFVAMLAAARGILWWLDRSLGVSFKGTFLPILRGEPVALGLYLGLRLLAVCILAAAFV